MDEARQTVPLAAVTGGMQLGGSSTFLLNLARALKRKGIPLPIVILHDFNAFAAEFAALGNPVYTLTGRRPIYEDRLHFGYSRLAQHHPQAVLSCLGAESFELLRIVPTGVARLGIIQSHDPGPYSMVRAYASFVDAMVGVSTEICRHLESLPEFQRTEVRHIPYGIDFPPAPVRDRETNRPLRLVYVGRLIEEQKRVSRLATLAQELAKAGVSVEFTFIGSGPAEPALREQLAGLDFVRFAGALPYEEVHRLLASQDAFVLLSDFEGLPLSLIEAMGHGLVPVVSDLPSGIAEAVTPESGIRVPVGDVSGAVQAVLALAADRPRLECLSIAAMNAARSRYSADTMAGQFLQLASTLARPPVRWEPETAIPVPLQMKHPWLYRGVARAVRRTARRLLG